MRTFNRYLIVFCITWAILGAVVFYLFPFPDALTESKIGDDKLAITVKQGEAYYLMALSNRGPVSKIDFQKPAFYWESGDDASTDIDTFPSSFRIEKFDGEDVVLDGRSILKFVPKKDGKLSIKCDLPPQMHLGVQVSNASFAVVLLLTVLGAIALTIGLMRTLKAKKGREIA